MAKRKRIYRAAPKAPFDDDIAVWIGQNLDGESEQVRPERLVELAKPASSPAHKLFVWDDKQAAAQHRYDRACYLLRHVEIEIVDSGNKTNVRACFPVYTGDMSAGDRRPYVSFDRIQKSPDLARQVVEDAARQLLAWQRRYAIYKSVFGSVFTAIEELEKELWPQQQSIASRKTAKRKPKQMARRRVPK